MTPPQQAENSIPLLALLLSIPIGLYLGYHWIAWRMPEVLTTSGGWLAFCIGGGVATCFTGGLVMMATQQKQVPDTPRRVRSKGTKEKSHA